MDDIIKIFGAAGTGKTTYLHNIFKNKAKRGNILYISFSNAAIDSMYDKLQMPRKSINTLRTLHSLCYGFATTFGDVNELYNGVRVNKALNNMRNNYGFIDGEYMRFCEKHKIPFSLDESHIDEGNTALSSWHKILSEYYPIYKSVDRCLSILSKQDNRSYDIISKWQQWKIHTQTVDWVDLEIFAYDNEMNPVKLGFSNCDTLMMDEAQDFSRLEWSIVDNMIKHVNRAYLAGDDCQTIYDFKGANASFFLDHDHSEEVILPKSYRLPSKILEFSKDIVNMMHIKKVKNISASCEGGLYDVMRTNHDNNTILQKVMHQLSRRKSIFVLFRTNSQAVQFRETCIKNRILPKNLKTSSSAKFWNKDLPLICSALHNLKNNGALKKDEWKTLLSYIKNKNNEESIDKVISLLKGDVIPLELHAMSKKYKWMDLLMSSDNYNIKRFLKNDAYRYAMSMGIVTPELYVDTIHASKGLESDVVFYIDAITENIQNELMIKGRSAVDNELRIAYVGCTRAKEQLYIMPMGKYQPFLTRFIGG